MAAPTPFTGSGIDRAALSDDDELIHILGRLESAKGAATRRAVVEQGLRSLRSDIAREKLALEASRIEVATTLDKVDKLKTASARRRYIKAALDALRADAVPDHLQRAEIQLLESALAENSGQLASNHEDVSVRRASPDEVN